MGWSTGKRIAVATAIAGTLDIAMASIDALSKGGTATGMLGGVASGPFPGASEWTAAPIAGLVVHFVIMAVIATVFIVARDRIALLRAYPISSAALYGLGVWLVMYGVVLHQRFGIPFPSGKPIEIAKQLFAHVVLVGVPIGVIARK